MQKYCENCGAKLNEGQNAFTECGNLINKSVAKSDKKNLTGYYISTSIVMMFISLCMFIADAEIRDMEDLAGILSKYILTGMTKGTVWAEGVANGVLYNVIWKMDELCKVWGHEFYGHDEI